MYLNLMNSFLNFFYKMLDYRKKFRTSNNRLYLTEEIIKDYDNIKRKKN